MTAKRTKTLSLQRAYFSAGCNSTLEDVIRAVFKKIPLAQDRRHGTSFLSFLTYASLEDGPNGSGVFLRIFEAEDGGTGVIDLNTSDSKRAVEEFFHPDNKKFLKEEVVLLVERDTIIGCNAKNKAGTLIDGVLSLAERAEVLNKGVRVRVADVPDRSTLERIEKIGVKEVDFSITSFLVSQEMGAQKPSGSRLMRLVFGMPDVNSAASRKRANAMGRLILKRGRFQPEEIRRDEWLTAVSREILEDETLDKYKITLEDDTQVSNSKLHKTKSVKISRHANSYDYSNAKLELEVFHSDLSAEGYLR